MGHQYIEMQDFSSIAAKSAPLAPAEKKPSAAPSSDVEIKSNILQSKVDKGQADVVLQWLNGYTDELLEQLHAHNPSLAHACAIFLKDASEKTRAEWNTWLNPTLKTLLTSIGRAATAAPYEPPRMGLAGSAA